jgi:hypothetical protein
VHFVDDVDLVATLRRCVAHVVAQVAHVIHAVVGGAVDLDHVEAIALGDFHRDVLLRIEFRRGGALGLERLREDARGRSLARPARPDEEIRLRDAAEAQRVGEGAHDGFLADDFGKRLGPVLARENLVGHEIKILLRTPGAASPEDVEARDNSLCGAIIFNRKHENKRMSADLRPKASPVVLIVTRSH